MLSKNASLGSPPVEAAETALGCDFCIGGGGGTPAMPLGGGGGGGGAPPAPKTGIGGGAGGTPAGGAGGGGGTPTDAAGGGSGETGTGVLLIWVFCADSGVI